MGRIYTAPDPAAGGTTGLVSLRVGAWSKQAVIFGDRTWTRDVGRDLIATRRHDVAASIRSNRALCRGHLTLSQMRGII